ncbi:YihY/virulence factor BrkB family protein [Candidatus Auribacterota bacterium]
MLKKLIHFITHDIWRIRNKDLSKSRSLLLKPLRVTILALRGFHDDECQIKASALTYFSLLSIVPVLAMAFGVAQGFGFEKILQKQLLDNLPGQEEILLKMINFAYSLLENTKGGMIAGIGVAILFLTVVKVLGNIESSFNHIWGIKKPRSMARKFSDYLSIMLICPFLFIISSSLTVIITSQIEKIVQTVKVLTFFGPLILTVLGWSPYAVIWILFSFVYIFMPNTKVKLFSGIIGGIIAGTIYQIVQFAYINFQVGVAKYNAIYGSFAALPLFLVWLQISWYVVLLGAEISFSYQNVDHYEFEPDCLKVSYSFKRLLSLRIMHLLIQDFAQGKNAKDGEEISQKLEIPIRLVRQIIFELVQSHLVSEVCDEKDKNFSYQPARDIDTFTIHAVIKALDDRGIDNIPVFHSEELNKLSESLKNFQQTIEKSTENLLLKSI